LYALALLPIPSAAQAVDGRQLLQHCEALVRGAVIAGNKVTLPKSRAVAECWYYMSAIQDLSATVDQEGGASVLGACVPPEATRMDIVWAFVKYARAHRDILRTRATAILIPALNESFPCKQ
jgi:hypothetical protein